MDKFSNMTMFACIVKNKGLAAADRELGLSPATVTARLQVLEDRYGIKLLHRSTRHISLTELGVCIIELAWKLVTASKRRKICTSGNEKSTRNVKNLRYSRYW